MKKIDIAGRRDVQIIEEADLWNYSKLFLVPAGVCSVVLAATSDTIWVALRDESSQLYMIDEWRAEWSEKYNAQKKEYAYELYKLILEDDRRVVTQLLTCGYAVNPRTQEFITPPAVRYHFAADEIADRAEEAPDWPSYIREHCAPEDCAGIYGLSGSGFWWWEEKRRVLHIMGSDIVYLPDDLEEYYERDSEDMPVTYAGWENSHPNAMALCLGRERKISSVMIHEGIRAFTHTPLMNERWGVEADEVLLPSTLYVMPVLKCFVDHVTVPETVSEIDLAELWVTCGGHFDPVSYAVRSLCLPSSIEIDVDMDDEDYHGQLPLLEPVDWWEEVVLYGDEPIADLEPWYKSNLFLCEIVVLYPAAWDKGAEVTFTERVVSYVRGKSPQYGQMSGMDSEWFDWGEEEYEALRERIRPYAGGRSFSQNPAAFF